jgi:hypothetical protein
MWVVIYAGVNISCFACFPDLKRMRAANPEGSIRNKKEIMLASFPGMIIILPLSISRTAISQTVCGVTLILFPIHPICLMVSSFMAGFVNTGPGHRQLTEIFFSAS